MLAHLTPLVVSRPRVVAAAVALAFVAIPAPALNLVREQTRTNEAVAIHTVTGAGVVVAILDRGIDWTHPDFRNEDGTTRIKWLLDMTGQQLCAGGPIPIEYSEADINASLTGGPAINSRDAVGHGTLTAGLAAGNGRASNGFYTGMAPGADLIVVKITSEGAPAHGAEPEEIPFQGCIEEALTWLDAKITELGKPCVAIINSGVQWGPMDGTSAVSRKIDEVFGINRPGRIYVSPSGDDGGFDSHSRATYTEAGETIVHLEKTDAFDAFLSLWYTGAQPAEVSIVLATGAFCGPVGPGSFDDRDGITIYQYDPGNAFYPWQSNGPDRAAWFRISGPATFGELRIRGVEPGTGTFDFYSGGLYPTITFSDHLTPGRLTDYSCTRSVITAGCHVLRDSWIDIQGILRFETSEGFMGEFWRHSSGGPTRDGRSPGVTLTAPGHNAFAPQAPNSYLATFLYNQPQNGGGMYGRAGATSASGPIVAGAVALMLEKRPTLTGGQARRILRDTAHADAFTGATPNNDWGFGKLDMLDALSAVATFCEGDANRDGAVNFFDLNIVLSEFGTAGSGLPGDLDGDDDCDFSDLNIVLSYYGTNC